MQQIAVRSGLILATRLHPFWDEGSREWIEARKLWPGNKLINRFGEYVVVEGVQVLRIKSDTYNLEIEGTHNYFVGLQGVLVHNGEGYKSGEKRPSAIYLVIKKNEHGGWDPFYVGSTIQGEGDPLARFKGHLAKKPEWKAAFERGEIMVLEEPIAKGEWTRFETAVWEEHELRRYGGLKKENPQSNLDNDIHALDEDSFKKYRSSGFGHNPCATT
jgi:hypothetical protein